MPCSVCEDKRFLIYKDNPIPCYRCNHDKRYKLIEITHCAGCGSPYMPEDAKLLGVRYRDCDCPCGTYKTLFTQPDIRKKR